MKLLSIETCDVDFIEGYIEIEEESVYARFSIDRGNLAVVHARFPKKDYRNYAHFAGVIGKFDPYAFLLKKPIQIQTLDFDSLYAIYQSTPALRVSL